MAITPGMGHQEVTDRYATKTPRAASEPRCGSASSPNPPSATGYSWDGLFFVLGFYHISSHTHTIYIYIYIYIIYIYHICLYDYIYVYIIALINFDYMILCVVSVCVS